MIPRTRLHRSQDTPEFSGKTQGGFILEVVYLLSAAVTEMLDHCGGLHEPDVLVRAVDG